ncbi:MAG TPA: hypothetical protein VHC49_11170, partial [Mycobacteriales bacterium]|nr:hypothetical protein [Mycobacteriales bacterium]
TIDEAKRLPARLIGLPVSAASTALQASLKVQQQYAGLIVRGDELLSGRGPEPEEAPSWAKFDDEEPEPGGDDELPLEGYDELTVPQLRARMRKLTAAEVQTLLDHESAHAARPPYLTMLANRLETLRSS